MQAVLFDLDDTLFDHMHSSRAGLLAVQELFDGRMSGTIEEIERTYRHLLDQWHPKVLDGSISIGESRIRRFRILLSDDKRMATDDEASRAAQCYRSAYDAAYRAVPGAVDLLRRLKSERRIGVVTNHVVDEQVQKIATIGVEPFIDELVVSEEVGVAKPDPHIFHTALSRLGPTVKDAVMIGDSWASDIEGAAGVSLRAIWLNRYGNPCPDPNLATEIHSLEPVDQVANIILHGN